MAGKASTPVSCKLRRFGDAHHGRWRAYDVVIEGVSLVANYRNTFADIAKSEGVEGLIADVKMRLTHWENGVANGSEGRTKE